MSAVLRTAARFLTFRATREELLAVDGRHLAFGLAFTWLAGMGRYWDHPSAHLAQSTGLVADSLDMFADAAVYGLALYAVGRSARLQVRAAHLAGVFQIVLALGVLVEVARRVLYGSEPESMLMMGIGAVALVANVSCLLMIYGHREGGAHMKASWIFSANDVLANIGVIAAGALVAWTGSSYPDLVIGTVVGLIVLNGARRILALKA